MMKESHSSEEKMFRENHYLTISDLIPDETNLLIRMLKFIAMFKVYENHNVKVNSGRKLVKQLSITQKPKHNPDSD